MQLTRAFQMAIGMLVTNAPAARQFIAGQLAATSLCAELTADDLEGLDVLARTRAERFLAIAQMVTDRRRRRVVALIPATAHALGERFMNVWDAYLRSAKQAGTVAPPIEAAAVAESVLRDVEPESLLAQLARYEMWRNRTTAGLLVRAARASDLSSSGPRVPAREIRVGEFVHVDRFCFAVDEVVAAFRSTGVIDERPEPESVYLAFHPRSAAGLEIGVTQIPARLHEVLQRARKGVELDALLSAIPLQQQSAMCRAVERLIALQVLETSEAIQ